MMSLLLLLVLLSQFLVLDHPVLLVVLDLLHQLVLCPLMLEELSIATMECGHLFVIWTREWGLSSAGKMDIQFIHVSICILI